MKYLFFDVDGTLVSPSQFRVPGSALDALDKVRHAGHQTFYCTGRSYGMCEELSYTGIENAIICNGAGIIIHNELVKMYEIPQSLVKEICEKIETLGGGYQILDKDYGYQNDFTYNQFSEKFKETEPEYEVEDVFKRRHMKHVREYQNTPILKIDFNFDHQEETEEFLNSLDSSLEYILAGGYQRVNGGTYGEIVLKGVNKGTGIEDVINYYHASIEDTLGFGDSTNDIEMLKKVHTSVVMGDGAESVKQYASFITKEVDNNGIAYALDTLVLKK